MRHKYTPSSKSGGLRGRPCMLGRDNNDTPAWRTGTTLDGAVRSRIFRSLAMETFITGSRRWNTRSEQGWTLSWWRAVASSSPGSSRSSRSKSTTISLPVRGSTLSDASACTVLSIGDLIHGVWRRLAAFFSTGRVSCTDTFRWAWWTVIPRGCRCTCDRRLGLSDALTLRPYCRPLRRPTGSSSAKCFWDQHRRSLSSFPSIKEMLMLLPCFNWVDTLSHYPARSLLLTRSVLTC
mmetsp:Transcript_24449/g.68519  ORF Transcript_24449/g.68519 Transcript_24449/m.68519 type:complete len:236 (+) Transcript_24449:1367-2074(+)